MSFLDVLPDTASLLFDERALVAAGYRLRDAYASADPFPHTVIDDFLPDAMVERFVEEFPPCEMATVVQMYQSEYLKRGYRPDDLGDRACRYLFYAFNSRPFLAFLEALTGIEGLVADPYFEGGGFHEIGRGGYLNVHADFTLQRKLNLRRRINVLIYLNRDWAPEYGGNLELWNADMSRCVRSVVPEFNRCVIFNTDRRSYHGHPDPLTCPPDRTRRSIALYYYTASPSIRDEIAVRGTDFRRRPGSRDDVMAASKRTELIKDLLPPILVRALQRSRKARGPAA